MGQIGLFSLQESVRAFLDQQHNKSGNVQVAVINLQNMTESTTSLTAVKLFEVQMKQPFTDLVSYGYMTANPTGGSSIGLQMYKNGTPQGSEITGNTANIYCYFPPTTFQAGDYLQLYGRCLAGGVTMVLNACIAYKVAAVTPYRSCFWFDAYINGLS